MKLHQLHRISILITGILVIISSCKEDALKKAPPPDIQVINVIQKDVPIVREFVGQVYGFLDIPIRARVEGYLEGIHFQEGRGVKKGQLLYSIDPQPFLAEVAAQESKVAEAQTYLVNAENELARYKPLAEINAVSKSDLDAAQASRDAAEASLDAAKANLRSARIKLSYCTIKSPNDGLIGKTEAREGEFVGREPNPVILNVVSQIDRMRVQFFLTESDYLILAKNLLAESSDSEGSLENPKAKQTENFELILADGTVFNKKGSFDFIDRNIDASTGSILLQTIFPNPDFILRPGMFAKVRVQMETVKNAILVPQRSTIEMQGQYSVYVVESGNIVKARQIEISGKTGDLLLVTSGLTSTDQIVVEGLQKVTSGLEVNPVVTEFKSQTNQ
jgi:membrane fusion protein, multidrug efflux system